MSKDKHQELNAYLAELMGDLHVPDYYGMHDPISKSPLTEPLREPAPVRRGEGKD